MKRKDIGLILLVGAISAVISLILSGLVISSPQNRRQSVEVVEPISVEFQNPDSTYFNSSSVNAAQRVQTGQEPNSKPFENL